MKPAKYLCGHCSKWITLTKDGNLRHHRSNEKEYPGSPWNKTCAGAGKKP